jgi:hypothetical protein
MMKYLSATEILRGFGEFAIGKCDETFWQMVVRSLNWDEVFHQARDTIAVIGNLSHSNMATKRRQYCTAFKTTKQRNPWWICR